MFFPEATRLDHLHIKNMGVENSISLCIIVRRALMEILGKTRLTLSLSAIGTSSLIA